MNKPKKTRIFWISSIVGFALLAVLIGFLTYFKVVNLAEALIVTVSISLIVWVSGRLPSGFDIAWPREESVKRSGARDEIPQLAWLLYGKNKRVSFGGMRNVRATAQASLESVGIDLHSQMLRPALEQFFGASTMRALTTPDVDITTQQLVQLIDRLEQVDRLHEAISQIAPEVSATHNFSHPSHRNGAHS